MQLSGLSRVVVAHNAVAEEDDPSTSDVLEQVAVVTAALAELGIPATTLAVADGRVWEALPTAPGTVVFNLVEAPPGAPQLHPATAAALELLGLPFTGSPAAALWCTTDKLATRALLAAHGIPVPPGGRLDPDDPAVLDRIPPPWIVKPAWEDASIGLEGDPVCATREAALARAQTLVHRFPGQPVLVERYLPGRELNVALLSDGSDGGEPTLPAALPVSEIVFQGFPEGVPHVLGYAAKWHPDSFEYTHTVRAFPSHPADAPLLVEARRLAIEAWRICGLRGYARVDLRLDEHGVPHVLEVNANPCLAADAGFLASAAEAGLAPREVVARLLAAALAGARKAPAEGARAEPRPPTSSASLRRGLRTDDRAPLAALLSATGFFNAEELAVALELIDDGIAQGEASHYRFLVAEEGSRLLGYACWGPIPGTAASADLYWIAVDPAVQGRGSGAALMVAAEAWMAEEGRRRVYLETSTRPQYEPTRRFYRACGYTLNAELPDYYAPGDGKAMFVKVLDKSDRREITRSSTAEGHLSGGL